MNREKILQIVKDLSYSQGFYFRLYQELLNNEDYLDYLEEQDFKDALDLILFLEE